MAKVSLMKILIRENKADVKLFSVRVGLIIFFVFEIYIF